MLRILLAENHNIVRNGIRMLLELDQEIKITGEAVNGRQLLEKITEGEESDIVLTDIYEPEMGGVALIKELRLLNPYIKIVILSIYDSEKNVLQAFMEGISGYLLKSVGTEELNFALKLIGNGGKYLCSELTAKMIENLMHNKQYLAIGSKLDVDFTSREIEVLNYIAEGFTNSEMSEKLFLSKRTIEGHRQSLIDKTSSKNTAALIRFAVLNGIIQ